MCTRLSASELTPVLPIALHQVRFKPVSVARPAQFAYYDVVLTSYRVLSGDVWHNAAPTATRAASRRCVHVQCQSCVDAQFVMNTYI